MTLTHNNPREFKVLRVIDQNGETQLAPDGQVGGAFLALCPGGRGRQPASDRRPGQRPAHRRGHAGTRRAVPQPGRTRVARFNPIDAHTVLLFIAVLSSPSPASAIVTSKPSCSTPRPRMTGRPD